MDEINVKVDKILSREDFGEICRCCLSSNTLDSIFELLYEETTLVNILNTLFNIQLDADDDLPKKICESCICEVIVCYNFRKRFEASETTLRNLKAIKVEDIKEEPQRRTNSFEEFVDTKLDEIENSIGFEENKICNSLEENYEQKVDISKQKQPRVFRCSCEEIFLSNWEFRQHRQLTKHDFLRDHQCKICGKCFPRDGLQIHMKTHEVAKRYKCEHCKKGFVLSRYLQLHMRTHTGEKPYVCEYCQKSFSQINSLTVHRRIHTGEKPYLCHICGKRFAKKATSDVHMRFHSKQKSSVSKPVGETVSCEKCGRICLGQTAYKLHLYKHGLGQGQMNKNDQHQCKICKKFFASSGSLYCHLRTHDNEKRFLCNECGKKFRSKVLLKSHSLTHSGEKFFACEFCGKSFTLKVNLQSHLLVHTGEKPYACHLCPKKFTQAGSLGLHLKIHTGERPYVCQFCYKAFGRKNVLDAHVRIHTGEKPYKCDQCTDRFSDPRILKKHKERNHQ